MLKLPRLSLAQMVLIVAVVAVGYFLFSAVSDALLSHQLNQDERRLQQDVTELTAQRAELEAIRDYLRTDEYIEGVARRLLGLVRPGETLYLVSSSAQPTPQPTPGDGDGGRRTWWEQLYQP